MNLFAYLNPLLLLKFCTLYVDGGVGEVALLEEAGMLEAGEAAAGITGAGAAGAGTAAGMAGAGEAAGTTAAGMAGAGGTAAAAEGAGVAGASGLTPGQLAFLQNSSAGLTTSVADAGAVGQTIAGAGAGAGTAAGTGAAEAGTAAGTAAGNASVLGNGIGTAGVNGFTGAGTQAYGLAGDANALGSGLGTAGGSVPGAATGTIPGVANSNPLYNPFSTTTLGTQASAAPSSFLSQMGTNALNTIQGSPWTTAGVAGLGLSLLNQKKYGTPGVTPYTGSLSHYGGAKGVSYPNNWGGQPVTAAQGGLMYSQGGIADLPNGYAAGGKLLRGPGDGMSDDIPARIGQHQEARLADGEFVMPADVVSHLGNGSTDAGAKQLYKMMENIRKARTGNPKQGKQIKPDRYIPT